MSTDGPVDLTGLPIVGEGFVFDDFTEGVAKMEKYYVIEMNDDGEWSVDEYPDLAELMEREGLAEPVDDYKEGRHPAQRFTSELPSQHGKAKAVIIKGRVLVPEPAEIVKSYRIPE